MNNETLYYLIIFGGVLLTTLTSVGIAIFISKQSEKKTWKALAFGHWIGLTIFFLSEWTESRFAEGNPIGLDLDGVNERNTIFFCQSNALKRHTPPISKTAKSSFFFFPVVPATFPWVLQSFFLFPVLAPWKFLQPFQLPFVFRSKFE